MSATDRGLSRAQILKQMDASLQRLKTDYVDLYQCHRYDAETPLEETMEALSQVVRAGKARYIGFSEWSPKQIEASFALPGVERFVSSQPQYSMLYRRPEAGVIPTVRGQWRFTARSSGHRWRRACSPASTGPAPRAPADSRAASDSMGHMMSNLLQPRILEAVQKLKPVVQKAGCTMSQFALAWVLRRERRTSPRPP